MFQKHLNPGDSLLYADFLNDLCKLIVSCVCVCVCVAMLYCGTVCVCTMSHAYQLLYPGG